MFCSEYLRFKYDLDKSTTHPKFNLTGVWTHDLQIMDSIFHVLGMLALTTEPSRTLKEMYCHMFLEVWGEHALTLK